AARRSPNLALGNVDAKPAIELDGSIEMAADDVDLVEDRASHVFSVNSDCIAPSAASCAGLTRLRAEALKPTRGSAKASVRIAMRSHIMDCRVKPGNDRRRGGAPGGA